MRDGAVFEQGGVKQVPFTTLNSTQRPEAAGHEWTPWYLDGVASPQPYVLSISNYRYFEAGPVWWLARFDALYPLPRMQFHLQRSFGAHHPEYYPVFKRWCDAKSIARKIEVWCIFFDQDGQGQLYRGPQSD